MVGAVEVLAGAVAEVGAEDGDGAPVGHGPAQAAQEQRHMRWRGQVLEEVADEDPVEVALGELDLQGVTDGQGDPGRPRVAAVDGVYRPALVGVDRVQELEAAGAGVEHPPGGAHALVYPGTDDVPDPLPCLLVDAGEAVLVEAAVVEGALGVEMAGHGVPTITGRRPPVPLLGACPLASGRPVRDGGPGRCPGSRPHRLERR